MSAQAKKTVLVTEAFLVTVGTKIKIITKAYQDTFSDYIVDGQCVKNCWVKAEMEIEYPEPAKKDHDKIKDKK